MARAVRGEFAYRKVYRYLVALIDEAPAAGACRLPSLRALSRRLRVSLATVQSAYNLLEEEGRVQCLPRSGYYAQGAATSAAAAMPRLAPLPAQPTLERALFSHERRLARQRAHSATAWAELGSVRLRNALAARYTRSSGQYWRAEDVQLAPDIPALLETLLAALGLQGRTVLVHSPCCPQVLRALDRIGMRVLEVPADPRGNPDLRALARLLESEPVCMVVMPSCLGMPQGRLVTPHYQQQLGELLARHPVWLLENDLDSDHCYCGPPTRRLRDWADPRWLLVMGAFEAVIGAEAPYAYVLGQGAVLAGAFAERGFRLAPLRLQALAQMLGRGRSKPNWSACERTCKGARNAWRVRWNCSSVSAWCWKCPRAGRPSGCVFASRWSGKALPRRWLARHCMRFRAASSACRGGTSSTWRWCGLASRRTRCNRPWSAWPRRWNYAAGGLPGWPVEGVRADGTKQGVAQPPGQGLIVARPAALVR